MIGNAVKFTTKGTIHLAINNQGLAGNHIRLGFVISDTGIGIAKEKLSGIFERFGRRRIPLPENTEVPVWGYLLPKTWYCCKRGR